MGKIVHTLRLKIVREMDFTRKALIEGFDGPIYYGDHDGIRLFNNVDLERGQVATLEHIVAATAS